jgi:hypothetical protein
MDKSIENLIIESAENITGEHWQVKDKIRAFLPLRAFQQWQIIRQIIVAAI